MNFMFLEDMCKGEAAWTSADDVYMACGLGPLIILNFLN